MRRYPPGPPLCSLHVCWNPYRPTGPSGSKVESASEAHATVSLQLRTELENVIGSRHASGLMALVDATGLAAMISVADEDAQFDAIIPLATDAQMKFIMPGRGRLVGTCQLDPDDRTILKDLLYGKCDRAQLTSDVEILDEAETLVRRGYMVWKLRRR